MKFVFEDGRINSYVTPRHFTYSDTEIIFREYIDGGWKMVRFMENTPANLEYAKNWVDEADKTIMAPAIDETRVQHLRIGFEMMGAMVNGKKVAMPDNDGLKIAESFRDAIIEMLRSTTFRIEEQK